MRFAPSARFLYTISLPPLLIASLLESSAEAPPRVSLSSSAFSGLYSFLGIFAVTYLSEVTNTPLVIASFGASAVLIYDAIDSPLAQPRNIVGGQVRQDDSKHITPTSEGCNEATAYCISEIFSSLLPLLPRTYRLPA